ncbi:peptidoglycan-binding protein [Streptomyces sp. C10-9-1]|uniref:peptidoglycan-binding domain-containing protein n=1 Tax=Streptomyces sp. C10-9-1 TaxID=1859285 RepID=UPI0021111F94|nr:peptidoglycan-binding domain-containing protein [Streptomyces sp. C10-9-1]MCQ6554986.1 peptidoglycan-binding protein [Streptomyces sp. C10-9-1]
MAVVGTVALAHVIAERAETYRRVAPMAPPESVPVRDASAAPTGGPSPETGTSRSRSTPGQHDTKRPALQVTALCCGAQGPEIAELQLWLRQIRLYDGLVHGTYTRRVERAVAEYQRSRGITGDAVGEYGPATREALQREVRASIGP